MAELISKHESLKDKKPREPFLMFPLQYRLEDITGRLDAAEGS
jgi:hypothetical protein